MHFELELAERYQLPPGLPELKSGQPLSPHLARPLGWAQASWRYNSVTGDRLSIKIRPAYYDPLDTDSGHVRNSKLVMGELQLSANRDRVYIDRFDLIGVDSANPGLTGLPGDTGVAWKLHTGAEQARLVCEHCLVARVQGDYGYGHQWSEGLFGAVYIGGALQSNWTDQGFGYARTSVDLILRGSDRFGIRLAHEQRFPVGSKLRSYGVTNTEMRWSIDQHSDLRLSYERDKAKQVSFGIGMYW